MINNSSNLSNAKRISDDFLGPYGGLGIMSIWTARKYFQVHVYLITQNRKIVISINVFCYLRNKAYIPLTKHMKY